MDDDIAKQCILKQARVFVSSSIDKVLGSLLEVVGSRAFLLLKFICNRESHHGC